MIVINEYKKSGGTWIVNVVARTVLWPRADLYDLMPEPVHVDVRHPWYLDDGDGPLYRDEFTVVKGHELPYSPLLPPNAPIVHLVRNPLDVAVSCWFYESEFLPKNNLGEPLAISQWEHFVATMETWSTFIAAWSETDAPLVTYETLSTGNVKTLATALATIGVDLSLPTLASALQAESSEVTRRSLGQAFAHNTFVRSAKVGDWKNHMTPDQASDLLRMASKGLACLADRLPVESRNDLEKAVA